jgi:hypothetical protein
VNESRIKYSVVPIRGVFAADPVALAQGSLIPPFSVTTDIREQTLLHVDWGTGYWLYREQGNRWLTGVAPTVEVHYTGTLNKAQVVQLPGDATASQFDPNDPLGAFFRNEPQVPERGPVVGGGRNYAHIVNVTAGTTFLLGQRTTLAVAGTVPVTNNQNKTFDWEAQVQLNYYFGGGGRLARPTTMY